MTVFDVLVIGGGPAGITIAKILGNKMNVGIIRPENNSMVYCAMPYVIEDIIPCGKTLKKDSLITDAGANLIRAKVTDVSFEEKQVMLDSGRTLRYRKLIIATGAEPILPPIPGHERDGVYTFKTEEDMKAINSAVKEGGCRKAVVVGAGAIGIELAQALNNIGISCHLVDMADSILPNLVDRDFVQEVQNELVNSGIELHLNDRVTALEGNDSVDRVVLDSGTDIMFESCGIVVFAVGMKANTGLFDNTDLEIDRHGIVINDRMETNVKDVYAVGDCAQYVSGISGEVLSGKLATNAVPMARMLAKNLLGEQRRYRGFYNGAATKVGSFFVGGTGFTETEARKRFAVVTGSAELTTTFPVMPGARKIKMKVVADRNNRKVIGAQIVSGLPVTDRIDTVTLAIQHGLQIDDLASFSYSAQPYQSFFPANHLVVACAEDMIGQLKSV